MNRRKLALLASSLAGGAVLIWALYGTLHDDREDRGAADEAAADSPLGRPVAHVGPPDRTASGDGWAAWSRSAADLRLRGDLAGGTSDGDLGDRAGRSFWSGEKDLDRGRVASARIASPGDRSWRAARKTEPALRGQRYRVVPGGKRTILTSGRRIGQPEIRLPDIAAVDIALSERERIPVRVEVCVDADGRPQEAHVLEGTGVASVDHYVARQLLDGRYRPLSQDGRRVGFCERTTIILGT